MNKYIITPLLLCCLALPAMADTVELQDNHPERHVVVKGDTLWGISAKFLKDPWQWPKVWRMNREQIKNPHRIYPGDVVVLDMSSGSPQLRLLKERTVVLEPGVRTEELDKQAIPTIQPNIINPFLTQPLVINNDGLDKAPIVIGGPDSRLALTPGLKVYVSKIEEGAGLQWHIYRPGRPLIDPDTRLPLGIEAIYLGDAKVLKYGEPATVEIMRAKEEIFTMDKLVAAPDKIQNAFIPRPPDADVTGRIIAVYDGVAEAGRNMIVSINRGSAEGLEEGHVLTINRTGRLIQKPIEKDAKGKRVDRPVKWEKPEAAPYRWGDPVKPEEAEAEAKRQLEKEAKPSDPSLIKLPDERIGLLMVFRTFEHVSYALIMQSSEQVNVLDLVKTP